MNFINKDVSKYTARNRITRMKIGETIIKLLDKTSLSEIRISSIVHLAGVSRMTFYKYYETKEDALNDYLAEIIKDYLQFRELEGVEQRFHTLEHLTFTLEFFAQYDDFLVKLERIGCYNILIDGVNHFLETYYQPQESIYHLYFYAGALLNVFMKWLKNGKTTPAREVARIILEGGPNIK